MNTRVDPFANLAEPLIFRTKARTEKPVQTETLERIAKENNFPSRQSPKPPKEPRRKKRVYTTGRNQQLNVKATNAPIERFYKLADERRVPLGALLDLALDALERAGGPSHG
jgi:hypothetical protein